MEKIRILGSDFLEFLESLSPPLKCPGCGNRELPTIAADGPDGMAHVVLHQLYDFNESKPMSLAHPTCAAFCQNCGYMWQFRMIEVHKRLLAIRGQQDNNG